MSDDNRERYVLWRNNWKGHILILTIIASGVSFPFFEYQSIRKSVSEELPILFLNFEIFYLLVLISFIFYFLVPIFQWTFKLKFAKRWGAVIFIFSMAAVLPFSYYLITEIEDYLRQSGYARCDSRALWENESLRDRAWDSDVWALSAEECSKAAEIQ